MSKTFQFDCMREECDLRVTGTFSEAEQAAISHRESGHWGILATIDENGYGDILAVLNQVRA